MKIEVDLSEYMEMKRKLGYAEGVILGVNLSLSLSHYSVTALVSALDRALEVLQEGNDA